MRRKRAEVPQYERRARSRELPRRQQTLGTGWAPSASVATPSTPCLVPRSRMQPLRKSVEVESGLALKEQQVLEVYEQVKASREELRQLQAAQQGCYATARLAAKVQPEMEVMRQQLRQSVVEAKKLSAWFTENAKRVGITEPSTTPAVYLEYILQACECRMGMLDATVLSAQEGGRKQQAFTASPLVSGSVAAPPMWTEVHDSEAQPPSEEGTIEPCQQALPPMWVRDPDAGS